MCMLSEEKKNLLIQNCHRMPVGQLADTILQYDNLSLDDFCGMNPNRKEKVAEFLSMYEEIEWKKIREAYPSEELLYKLSQYINRGENFPQKYCYIREAKKYFYQVLRSIVQGKTGHDKEEMLKRHIGLYQQINEAIYRMRYYGDVFFKNDDLYIELFRFLIELPKSDQKELRKEYIVQWGICAESIGRCWPCLPSHKLTAKEENDIYLDRISIAANYINLFPDSLFCESAYSIINDDLQHIDIRFIQSKDVLRYIEPKMFGNNKLQSLFTSFFSYRLSLNPTDLLSFVRQESHVENKLLQDNIADLNNESVPKTLIINIGKWGCGKTSLIMSLSNAHIDSHRIYWEHDFNVIAKEYLESGYYPAPSNNWYSIMTAQIQEGKEKACLQFVDSNYNMFCRQLLEGWKDADCELSQGTRQIISSSNPIILNILVDPTEPKYSSWETPANNNQEIILSGILDSLEWYHNSEHHHFWKNVIKINIIIMKYDLIENNRIATQILADKKNNFQLDKSQMEMCFPNRFANLWERIDNIIQKWGIKSELLIFSIGKPILSDRYEYNNSYANDIMHSLIMDIPFSKNRIIPRWLNFICKK